MWSLLWFSKYVRNCLHVRSVYLVCPSVPPCKTKCPPAPFSSPHLTPQARCAIFENANASQPGSLLTGEDCAFHCCLKNPIYVLWPQIRVDCVSVFRAASLLTLATKTGWSVKLRMVKHSKPFSYKLKVPKEGKGTICSISNNWAGRTTEISPNGFQISLKEVCYQ